MKETWATGTVSKANASGKFFRNHIANRKEIDGIGCLYKVFGIGEDGLGYRYFTGPKKANAAKGKFYSGVPLHRLEELELGTALKFKPIPNFWNLADAFGNCRHEGGIDFGAGKKPVGLIAKFLDIAVKDDRDAIVLDFFAGSGSTAHAVFESNLKDKSLRKFILVQLPQHLDTSEAEQKDKNDFLVAINRPPNLAELTKERLRRMSLKYRQQTNLFEVNLGFRVFKLDTTGVRPWDSSLEVDEQRLLAEQESLVPGRSEEDLLFELMLKRGLELTAKLEERQMGGLRVFRSKGDELMACMAERVGDAEAATALAEGMAAWYGEKKHAAEPPLVVVRDAAFDDDVAKANFVEILKQHGLRDVRSL